MKRLAIVSSAALFSLALGVAGSLSAQKTATYTGPVMDSPCALLGGHMAMAQKGESEKDCTVRCVKGAGQLMVSSTTGPV